MTESHSSCSQTVFFLPMHILYIIKDGSIFRGLANSLLVTAVGTFINMFMSTTLAYPLARSDFRWRNGITNMVIVTMLFGGGMGTRATS